MNEYIVVPVCVALVVLGIVGGISYYHTKAIGADSDPGRTERQRQCVKAGGSLIGYDCIAVKCSPQ